LRLPAVRPQLKRNPLGAMLEAKPCISASSRSYG